MSLTSMYTLREFCLKCKQCVLNQLPLTVPFQTNAATKNLEPRLLKLVFAKIDTLTNKYD